MKRRRMLLTALAAAALLSTGCPAPTAPDAAGSPLPIAGLEAPIWGVVPVTSLDAPEYTGIVSWSPPVSGAFAADTAYTAAITLTPKAGIVLADLAADGFTVPGASDVSCDSGTGLVTAVFPSTKHSLAMITVPAGRFQRNSTAGDVSEITHAFKMSRREITRAQFLAVLGSDPTDPAFSSGANDPVLKVSWYQAIAFCNKLSLASGLDPVYSVSGVDFGTLGYPAIPTSGNVDWNAASADWSKNGYRLPTETEWMWAAMGAPAAGQGGGIDTTGYAKPFAGSAVGNVLAEYAVYQESKSKPAGSRLANELGLYDMSGNALEWTWDRYADPYPSGTLTDYRGPDTGPNRVQRGGSWDDPSAYCAVGWRGYYSPQFSFSRFGFRVVRP